MFDQSTAYAYEPDVTVEEQDVPVIPIRSRTATDGALTMQVYVAAKFDDGVEITGWHRRTPDLATTACGFAYNAQFAPTRREELCLPLCPACFTKFELGKAALAAAKDAG